MNRENFLKFDSFFSKIAFVYIVLIPFFFLERNRIIFICFSLLFFIERLVHMWYIKDNFSKTKKIVYALIAMIYIACSIGIVIELFSLIWNIKGWSKVSSLILIKFLKIIWKREIRLWQREIEWRKY